MHVWIEEREEEMLRKRGQGADVDKVRMDERRREREVSRE